jgi:SAM-dependent methyltransferase
LLLSRGDLRRGTVIDMEGTGGISGMSDRIRATVFARLGWRLQNPGWTPLTTEAAGMHRFGVLLGMVLLAACGARPQLPELSGEAHQLPYGGPIRSMYWGALKSDPNWFVVEVQSKLFYVFGEAVRPSVQSAYLLENTVINPGEDVWDLGTGSGVQAIFAANNARRIVATDIGGDAIKSAQYNVKLHRLEDKIDVRLGDLFAPLKDDEQFDVIINNIDYPENDPDHPLWAVHRRFFEGVSRHLKLGGRILYQSGSIDNMPRIRKLIWDNGYYIVEAHLRHMVVQDKDIVFYLIQRRGA